MFRILFVLGICITILSVFTSAGQSDVSSEVVNGVLVDANYSLQIPSNDMAKRFGINSNIGGALNYKLSNWLIGLEANLLFGKSVKEDDILDGLTTANGLLINSNGLLSDYKLFERGLMVRAEFGKVFGGIGPNPNSGILVKGGIGVLQHKILIDVDPLTIPQLNQDYQTGYDRLSSGLVFSQFIGYMFLDNNKFINFYGGFEFMQGLTTLKRNWLFDKNSADTSTRLDILYGIKVGWIIPIYSKDTENQPYYY